MNRVGWDATRLDLEAAIGEAQAAARERLVDPAALAGAAWQGRAVVLAIADRLGLTPAHLSPSSTWWSDAGPSPQMAPRVATLVELDDRGLTARRHTPSVGLSSGYLRLYLRSADVQAAAALVGTPPRPASSRRRLEEPEPPAAPDLVALAADLVNRRVQHELVLVRDLVNRRVQQDRLQAAELEQLRARLEELHPIRDPDGAADAVEDVAARLEALSEDAACVLCGCRQHSPCETPHGPCGWATQDLCTACSAVAELIDLSEEP